MAPVMDLLFCSELVLPPTDHPWPARRTPTWKLVDRLLLYSKDPVQSRSRWVSPTFVSIPLPISSDLSTVMQFRSAGLSGKGGEPWAEK